MNKKVSTILTLSLLLGGSLLSSSAFAEVLPLGAKVSKDNPLDTSKKYFIVQDCNTLVSANDATHGALGYDFVEPDREAIKPMVTMLNADVADSDLNKYLWTVTKSSREGSGFVYTFTNVYTNEKLRVNYNPTTKEFDKIETSTKAEDQVNDAVEFAFNYWAEYKGADTEFDATQTDTYLKLWVSASCQNGHDQKIIGLYDGTAANLTVLRSVSGLAAQSGINLYSVADDEINEDDEAGALNALYNRAGFNFKMAEGVENIFGNEPVKAIYVKDDLKASGDKTTKNYYAFPQGTYFATSTPTGSYPTDVNDFDSQAELEAAQLEYLKGCTFIAVSPTNNIDGDADCQKAGRGFALTEVSANDLNLYAQTAPGLIDEDLQTKGSQISVFNACFTGWQNPAEPEKFALALNRIYYVADSEKADEVHATAKVALNVISHHHDLTNDLVTDSDYKVNYVFTLDELAAIDPTDILVEDGASIFNIQFVSGETDDHESEYGKYLTVVTNSNEDYWANGSAIADLKTPAYEFVVSKVSGKDITFTNRETGKSFTAKLFKYGENENEYSIALASTTPYKVSDIKDNGDVEEVTGATFNLEDSYIKLIRVEGVDKFDGFVNVADETIMTMALARDYTPTSEKLYPIVDSNNNFPTGNDVKFTDEVSEAVQWQLVKATDKPKYQTYNYYYIKDGKAVVKNWGDTVAVQAYNLQLIKDGQAIADKYLHAKGSNNASGVNLVAESSATDFYIKNNVDGSVSIKIADSNAAVDGTVHVSTQNYDVPANFNEKVEMQMRSIAMTSNATDVKVYLFDDSPLKSWQNQGHVTLQTEMTNYITKDENNAGVVNSNEPETFYLTKTDTNKAIPSFYISKGINGDAESERLYLFNPVDSVPYLVNAPVDVKYEWDEVTAKAIFKAGTLVTPDTMKTIIKGDETLVAQKADNKGVEGGLNRFKFQIVETEDEDGFYYIRQINSPYIDEENGKLVSGNNTLYLRNLNGKLTWTRKLNAERVKVAIEEVAAPTANESVSASEVKVIAVDGAINIKNAAGKNVVVSTILGQIVANEVLTSDNATISVPAGIAIVSVDGEEAVKVSVR